MQFKGFQRRWRKKFEAYGDVDHRGLSAWRYKAYSRNTVQALRSELVTFVFTAWLLRENNAPSLSVILNGAPQCFFFSEVSVAWSEGPRSDSERYAASGNFNEDAS